MFLSEKQFSEAYIEYCRENRHLFVNRQSQTGDWCYSIPGQSIHQMAEDGSIVFDYEGVFYLPDFDFLLEYIRFQIDHMGYSISKCEVTITKQPGGDWSVRVALPQNEEMTATKSVSLGIALFETTVRLAEIRTQQILKSIVGEKCAEISNTLLPIENSLDRLLQNTTEKIKDVGERDDHKPD